MEQAARALLAARDAVEHGVKAPGRAVLAEQVVEDARAVGGAGAAQQVRADAQGVEALVVDGRRARVRVVLVVIVVVDVRVGV